MAALVAYDEAQVRQVLRDTTPHQLLLQIHAGTYDRRLTSAALSELSALLQAWEQRALGMVMLRDALVVDRQRGAQVYNLLCTAYTVARLPVPPALAATFATLLHEPASAPQALAVQPIPALPPDLAALIARARQEGLTVAWLPGTSFAFPADLEALLPTPPPPLRSNAPLPRFEQPTGWRRTLALLLALAGVALLAVPLLLGEVPGQPARLPLGLMTLALLVGIRAQWTGYLGSLCIWLVPNLPWFHHGSSFAWLPTLGLLTFGTVLLMMDSYVRALWRWIRQGNG
ncbi:MAG: hypothetical protein HC914_07495 [Chloroflexaceae bacterium]|nr:hypothetical protein [Chloroflexaceae bacterium]